MTKKGMNKLSGARIAPGIAVGMVLLAAPLFALAQTPGLPAFTSTPAPGGGQNYSLSLQTLLLLTSLTFLPAALLMMTGFTRIIIVLSLLRQALGTQSSPPNQVLVGLALFLTFFVMGPVFDRIYEEVANHHRGPQRCTSEISREVLEQINHPRLVRAVAMHQDEQRRSVPLSLRLGPNNCFHPTSLASACR